jgi:hypothetical protein
MIRYVGIRLRYRGFGAAQPMLSLIGMTIGEKRKILRETRELLARLGNNQPSGEVQTVVNEMIRRLRELETSL